MTTEAYDSAPDCDICQGKGYVEVLGMLDKEVFPCWVCKRKGVVDHVQVQDAASVRRSIDAATTLATERDRPKTKGDRLAFAIQHATDGQCP